MRSWSRLALAFVAACSGPAAAQEDDFKNAVLTLGETKLKPSRVFSPAQLGWRTRDLFLSVDKGEVVATRRADGSQAWRVAAPEGRLLQGLATAGEVFYLQQWEAYREGQRDRYRPDGPEALRRLSLRDGSWLKPLKAAKEAAGKIPEVVHGILPVEAGLAVLSALIKDSGDFHETQIESYRVALYKGNETSAAWHREIKSAGEVPSPGVALLSPGGPRYARADVNPISVAGDKLIVCAGAAEDIVSFELASGEEKWRLEAVWEFERGFIGPSVWQHFIERFGEDDFRGDRKVDPEKRKSYRGKCRIVGGPLVVRHGDGQRLFAAVSKATGEMGGYLSSCFVYEIADDGKPVAITPMPRMIIGSEHRLLPDGILWRCEKGAMALITPSRQTRGIGMGPFGKSDCLGRLAWYLQPPEGDVAEGPFGSELKWWLSTAKAGDPTSFDETSLFRLPEGGYVKKQGDREFHFPITRTELPGGKVTALTLTVPYPKEITPPQTNRSDSGGKIRALTPHLLAITVLNYQEGELEITLGSEGKACTLLFQVGK